VFTGLSSGRVIRTPDLWVMSPTSYPCSIPQYVLNAEAFRVKSLILKRTFFYCGAKI
jgi:hypothetical protein